MYACVRVCACVSYASVSETEKVEEKKREIDGEENNKLCQYSKHVQHYYA